MCCSFAVFLLRFVEESLLKHIGSQKLPQIENTIISTTAIEAVCRQYHLKLGGSNIVEPCGIQHFRKSQYSNTLLEFDNKQADIHQINYWNISDIKQDIFEVDNRMIW